VGIAALGALIIYHRDLPSFLIPAKHAWISDHVFVVYMYGALLFLAGAWIVFRQNVAPIALPLGTILLLIFCLYFVPYELTQSANYRHFGDWEDAFKELTFAGGAFVLARSRLGYIIYPLAILSFAFDHFLYAKEAAGYVPDWVSNKVTWLYLTGAALAGSSLAILFGIRPRLFAALLGSMIFIWVIILHIPKVLHSGYYLGEVYATFIALAYCGIAFAIAGGSKK
jgi:hypothetical protein